MATGYGGVLTAAVAFLLIAVLVQPVDRVEQQLAAGPGAVVGGPGADYGQSGQPGATVPGQPGAVAGQPGAGGQPGVATPGGSGTVPPTGCTDRSLQVIGDPYSPPCIAFAGNNGGATSRGVTAEEIIISARELEGPSAAEIF